MVEVVLGAAMLAIAIVALLGAFLGQVALNEHARNRTLAMNDASRVMEQLRLRNADPCAGAGGTEPTAVPLGSTDWNAWLASAAGGGKSIQPNPNAEERVIVTCLRRDAPSPPANPGDYCGDDDQLGTTEWRLRTDNTNYDPLRITVSVCWRERNRTIGECTWDGVQLTAVDGTNGFAANGVIESPVSVTTLLTCRG